MCVGASSLIFSIMEDEEFQSEVATWLKMARARKVDPTGNSPVKISALRIIMTDVNICLEAIAGAQPVTGFGRKQNLIISHHGENYWDSAAEPERNAWLNMLARKYVDIKAVAGIYGYTTLISSQFSASMKSMIRGGGDKEMSAMLTTPARVLSYAKSVGHRVPDHEKVIAKKPEVALEYATYFKFRWEELEDKFLYLRSYSVVYYCKANKFRWPEFESKLLNNLDAERYAAIYYCQEIIGRRWPRLEQTLLARGAPYALEDYACNVIRGRWPEAEPMILDDYRAASGYSRRLEFNWPEFNQKCLTDPEYAKGDSGYGAHLRDMRDLATELGDLVDGPQESYLDVSRASDIISEMANFGRFTGDWGLTFKDSYDADKFWEILGTIYGSEGRKREAVRYTETFIQAATRNMQRAMIKIAEARGFTDFTANVDEPDERRDRHLKTRDNANEFKAFVQELGQLATESRQTISDQAHDIYSKAVKNHPEWWDDADLSEDDNAEAISFLFYRIYTEYGRPAKGGFEGLTHNYHSRLADKVYDLVLRKIKGMMAARTRLASKEAGREIINDLTARLSEMRGFSIDGVLTNDNPPKFVRCSGGLVGHYDVIMHMMRGKDIGGNPQHKGYYSYADDAEKFCVKNNIARIAVEDRDSAGDCIHVSFPNKMMRPSNRQQSWLVNYGREKNLPVRLDVGWHGIAIYEPQD